MEFFTESLHVTFRIRQELSAVAQMQSGRKLGPWKQDFLLFKVAIFVQFRAKQILSIWQLGWVLDIGLI